LAETDGTENNMRTAREEKTMSNENPLITSNPLDTIETIKEFLDFLCVSASNDEELAGMVLPLRVVQKAVGSLAEKRDEN
jgi:hypothetical protein